MSNNTEDTGDAMFDASQAWLAAARKLPEFAAYLKSVEAHYPDALADPDNTDTYPDFLESPHHYASRLFTEIVFGETLQEIVQAHLEKVFPEDDEEEG